MALDIKKGLERVKLPSLPWGKLAKLNKLHKIVIATAIVALLWGGFLWFLYLPQTRKIDLLEANLRTARVQLDRVRRVEKNLRRFKKDLKETELKFKKALQLLPDKEEIPALLTSISSLGAKSGLEFLLFRPQKEIPRNFYAEIPLKLELSGPYHSVATFFDRVSRLSRIVNISDMNMSKLKTENDVVILKTDCTATTYKFIEARKAPKKKRKRR